MYMANTDAIVICWEVLPPNFTQPGLTMTFIKW